MSASLGGRAGRHQQLIKPAEVRFRHLRQDQQDARCVYWDLESLSWSGRGCRVVSSNDTDTVCRCGHLAAFALVAHRDANGVTVGNVDATEGGGMGIFQRYVPKKQ